MKYLLLDVSGTLLYKPVLFKKIEDVLFDFGYVIPISKIKYHHKLLSETIHFPDRTDEIFYNFFNSELLLSLGVIPNPIILKTLFSSCSYLPWEKYEDTIVLEDFPLPIGILSNFNNSLENKLHQFFGTVFLDIFISEVVGFAKPSIEFYKYALNKLELLPEEIIYVGDSYKLDFKPANELGITTLVIDRDGFYPESKTTIRSLFDLKNKLVK
ncbi:haloacid dehalogenase [Flavobacterium limnosediminis JC2902]|uniref:Haloacid dehalogenase n=1 Tax=Flavobacterium limnosediminis JC2902 TaxID=1341181 RepID=V6SI69_9FLAO|nr:HAD family hydrolase [Flavobacterium limnosediminis]ESU25967.1 haloacid dehalogenase [Flavobacterium limnosediminis JC2902]